MFDTGAKNKPGVHKNTKTKSLPKKKKFTKYVNPESVDGQAILKSHFISQSALDIRRN